MDGSLLPLEYRPPNNGKLPRFEPVKMKDLVGVDHRSTNLSPRPPPLSRLHKVMRMVRMGE